MKIASLVLALLSLSLILFSCKKDNPIPPEEQPKISLSLEDVSCTEAWIKLSTSNLTLPASVDLLKDSSFAETIILKSADTILYVDSLFPNKTYSFSSIIQSTNQSISSDPLTVSTMDTTSHNFTWQTWTFGGQAGSCTLYDVAIIDENDIWAVGEIYLLDSLGQPDPLPYNAVHWDGNQWKVKRIQTYFRGNLLTVLLEGIFAISSTDIWLVGSLPIHGDGENWVMYDLRTTLDPNLSLSKAWGSNTNDMYFVGRSGSIVHYQNGSWSRIESGTDLQFLDIYGNKDFQNDEEQIIAVCTRNLPMDKGIFTISGDIATEISSSPIQWELFGLWFIPNRHYYVVGDGIYEKNSLQENSWRNGPVDITHYATTKIKGNGLNDIYVVGAFGEFLHFNGLNWKSLQNETGWFNGSYASVATVRNLVCAVGYKGAQGIIIMGDRN